MKKSLFLVILFFASLSSYAQQVNNTEFKTKTLQVYQNLDKSRIPHGILLDYGMEFTNLQAFNGVLTDSTFTTSQTLTDIYKTLLMCRAREVTTGFVTPQEYATRWYSQRTQGVISLSGLFFKYNRFADSAYPSKLNYSNNKFSDKFVNSVWQNPYEEKQLFAMTTSISRYRGKTFQVKLPSNLFFSNYPTNIQSIQVDFSDGLGYRTVTYNQPLTVSYTQANTYTWKYKITLTNGQTLLSHSKIIIEKGLNSVPINTGTVISANNTPGLNANPIALAAPNPPVGLPPYGKINIVASQQYLGHYGSATVYVRYATTNTIKKPLIVAEGLDPGIVLNPEQEAGDNNIEDFIDNYSLSNSALTGANGFGSYDIIYVDWDNGVDFIQRNAYALEEVIKWVNTMKAAAGSTTPNVIIGQSMGGLVARFALRDIEVNRNFNHDTRLYISHDAPHLGANTPISVQLSARHLRNQYVSSPTTLLAGEVIMPLVINFAEGFSQIINLFGANTSVQGSITPLQGFSLADVAAARQMQYNWVDINYYRENTIHDAWQATLTQLGYPLGYPSKPIRNVAIANGSECGVLQPDNNNIMSYIKDAGRDTFLSDYVGLLDGVYAGFIDRPDIAIVATLFPGKSYWEINFQSKYMTILNQNKNIYHGSIKYKKKVFWFIPVSMTVTELDVTQPSGVLPYDIYGGGRNQTSSSQLPLDNITSNSFGFIPTASALDIGQGSTAISDIDYRKSYVGGLPPALPKNSPFINYVTHFDRFNPSNNNSAHISFNRRNGDWLTGELLGGLSVQTANCSYTCASFGIQGPSLQCNASQIYTAPSGATTYNWTVTTGANLVTLTGNGTPNVTLTVTGAQAGNVSLVLTMDSDACGSITLPTKIIRVYTATALPIPAGYFQVNGVECLHDGVLPIQFFPSNGFKGDITLDPNFLPHPLQSQTRYITVTYTNPCTGAFTTKDFTYNYQAPDCSEAKTSSDTSFYKVYPNPSSSTINVDLRDNGLRPSSDSQIIATLYNMMSETKGNVQVLNNVASINVSTLPKGIYILKINVDGAIESHQVIVQ